MNLLMLGANSDVAYALAKQFAKAEQADICLASRDLELLEKKATDLHVRYQVSTKAVRFDACDHRSHRDFYINLNPKPDIVVVAFGDNGDQQKAQQQFDDAMHIVHTNFTGALSILEIVAEDFEKRQQGTIIGISSVAGERGRRSNYIYGASKAALTTYLSGLRNRLFKSRVKVITVLPGFIATKMNKDLQLPSLLTAGADKVAEDIYNAYKKSRHLIYTAWYWRWIMAIIKAIPEFIFKRLNL